MEFKLYCKECKPVSYTHLGGFDGHWCFLPGRQHCGGLYRNTGDTDHYQSDFRADSGGNDTGCKIYGDGEIRKGCLCDQYNNSMFCTVCDGAHGSDRGYGFSDLTNTDVYKRQVQMQSAPSSILHARLVPKGWYLIKTAM